jgi:adenosylcobinamide-GDP ribazoletransferase
LKALLSFFTVLPVRGTSLDGAAREAYLLPLVGIVTGLPGAILLLAAAFIPPGVVSTLALGVVLAAAGLHHADGVLDVGDALMVRGSAERRRAVLKDTRVGIGGIGALFLVYAPAMAALIVVSNASPLRAALALLAGEVAARSAMVLTLAFGEPAEAGSTTAPFVRALSGPRHATAVALALLVPLPFLFPVSSLAPVAMLAAPLVALVSLRISGSAFGGIGGDVVGASGELCRTVVLVAISALV